MVWYRGVVISDGGAFSPCSGASWNRICRVVDDLSHLRDQFIDGISGKHANVQIRCCFRGNHVDADARLENRRRDRIAQHRVPHWALFGEMLDRQIGALGLLERAHPFGNFIVLFDLRKLLEITPDNRIGLSGHLISSPVSQWLPPSGLRRCLRAAWKRGPKVPSLSP